MLFFRGEEMRLAGDGFFLRRKGGHDTDWRHSFVFEKLPAHRPLSDGFHNEQENRMRKETKLLSCGEKVMEQ